jgi:hypothetical protein
MLGLEIRTSLEIRNGLEVEPLSLVRNPETKSLSQLAPTANVNKLSRIHPVSVNHCIAYRFAKRQFDLRFRAGNAMRPRDERHQTIHHRRDCFDVAAYPTIDLEQGISRTSDSKMRLKI